MSCVSGVTIAEQRPLCQSHNMRCFPHCSRQRDAFTLIELLVTVSIISILAALTLGSFSTVRRASDKAACAANLRSAGQAIQEYAADHDSSLPGPVGGGQATIVPAAANQLAYYLAAYMEWDNSSALPKKMVKSLVCPAWLRPHASDGGLAGWSYAVPQGTTDLVSGGKGSPFGNAPDSSDPAGTPPQRLSNIKYLSQAPALVDLDGLNYSSYLGKTNVPSVPIHVKKRNQLFLDGHVDTIAVNVP